MKLSEIVTKSCIFIDLKVSSKRALFKEISQMISQKTKLNINDILEKLNEREKLGSTTIGDGVAIPHTKISGLKKVFSIFIKLKKSIDFSSSDSSDVDLIFVIIAPKESQSEHLMALAKISGFLKIKKNVDKLRKTKSQDEVYNLLESFNEA